MILAAALALLAIALVYAAVHMLIAGVRLIFWLFVALFTPPGLYVLAGLGLLWAVSVVGR